MKRLLILSLILSTLFLTSCAKSDKITVGSVIFESTNEWFVEAIAGMDAAAEKSGVTIKQLDSRYDVNVEKDLIQEQIKNKADAIVICPLTVEESGQALSKAAEIGIPIVTWNTVVSPAPRVQVVVDNRRLGSATGEYLAEYIRKNNISKLNMLCIINTEFSIGKERVGGFKQSVEPLVKSGVINVVADIKGHLYEETCVTVEKMLTSEPEINFIWCWNQMTTDATVDTLRKIGRNDVLVAGTDMSMALAREMTEHDNVIAITTQQPYEMGFAAVEAAVKAVKNEETPGSITIPTITYTVDNKEDIKKYIKTHEEFLKK